MKLEIITPNKIEFSGEVSIVTLPGVAGSFSILDHHAPLISALSKGILSYQSDKQKENIEIEGGFVEVNKNIVTVCIEAV